MGLLLKDQVQCLNWSIYDIALLKLILKNLLDDIIIVLIVVSREMNQVLWVMHAAMIAHNKWLWSTNVILLFTNILQLVSS